MKGNYIGKKPSGYGAISASKAGIWEVYDQGQSVKDSQWSGQPWEVNNGYYLNKTWTVGINESSFTDFQFNNDGTKFYAVGTGDDTIYQYSCSTAWDINSASYENKFFKISNEEPNPQGLFFKSDGTKFYIIGYTNNTIYQYSCPTAWDVSTAFYDYVSFSVATQETSSNGLFFKSDGTKFYIIGSANDTIYQYSCSTAWDVSTASYDSVSFSVATEEPNPQGLFFKSDGTKFYIVGSFNDVVYQYSCSTAWDISTATYDAKFYNIAGLSGMPVGLCFKSDGSKLYVLDGISKNIVIEFDLSTNWDVSTGNGAGGTFYVGQQETEPNDVFFKSDGTKFYIIGSVNDTIYQYSCSTAWDISTASYDSVSFSVATEETTPTDVFFKSDGTKFYIVGSVNDAVYQYTCSTAWDISTASYDSVSFSVATEETNPQGLFFKSDGTKFYIVGTVNDRIYQYSCSTAWDISTASYDSVSFSVSPPDNNATGLFFKPDGTKFYIIGDGNDRIYQYSCSTAWDVSTASYDSVFLSVNTQEANVQGLFFKSDGVRLYFIGRQVDTVLQYDLPLAWDVRNAGLSAKLFPLRLQDTGLRDLTFSLDGTKLYTVDERGDAVYQYTCSTPWDITTATFNYASSGAYSRTRVDGENTYPTAVFFKTDGTKFYVAGYTGGNRIYQYSCSTAWDVSTASYDSVSFSVNTQESSTITLSFKSDGTKFYILGSGNDAVFQYSCSTAWDVSTASYDSVSFSVNTQDNTPTGLFFKSDGTKFYIVGSQNDNVHQYSCSTAWDISTASYDSKLLKVRVQDSNPRGLTFNDYGNYLYICGTTSPQGIYQYSLV